MTKKRIFNFDNEFAEVKEDIKNIHLQTKSIAERQDKSEEELDQLLASIKEYLPQELIQNNSTFDIHSTNKKHIDIEFENHYFLEAFPISLDKKMHKEIHNNKDLIPPFSNLDWCVVGIIGTIATVVDLLLVKIPTSTNYLNKFEQDPSKLTTYLRSIGLNEDQELSPFLIWLEKKCKVPYDQSINPSIDGFYPKSHRLMNLGHDPLIGMIFGVLDTFNGSMSVIDSKGKFQVIPTKEATTKQMIYSPLIWLGHIVSDVCTKMGIPIPGWGLLQLAQFGSLGDKDRTVADLSRWMYLNGYDIRHFMTMGTVPGTIEVLIRGYHYFGQLENKNQLIEFTGKLHLDKEIEELQSAIKLNKMIFYAHSLAAGGNLAKIFINHGNPLAYNTAQWIALAKSSRDALHYSNRDRTTEKINRNRKSIQNNW